MSSLCLNSNDINPILLKPDFFQQQSLGNGWKNQSVQGIVGFNCFQTGRICRDIQLTLSHCAPVNDYHCHIQHPQATTLILFGEQGISHFAFQDQSDRLLSNQRIYTVRPGDLWLINLVDGPLMRMTPANQSCQMQVIKFASERLSEAWVQEDRAPADSLHRLGNQAIRLSRQGEIPPALQKLKKNALANPIERLLAEATALELIAHYLNLLADLSLGQSSSTAIGHNHSTGAIHSDAILSRDTQTNAPANPTLTSAQPELEQAITILLSDLANPPSLEQLALSTGMSHTRLNREFKRVHGQTVFSWLRQYRLQQASHALRHSQEEITQIAHRLGFSHASHLSSQFKQQFGCTPLQYRLNA